MTAPPPGPRIPADLLGDLEAEADRAHQQRLTGRPGGPVTGLAPIDDLRVQLAAQSDTIAQLREAHTAELSRLIDAQSEQIDRLIDAHSREVATLRDVNRDQFVILERLSVPRLPDSQSTAPRPWWRLW